MDKRVIIFFIKELCLVTFGIFLYLLVGLFLAAAISKIADIPATPTLWGSCSLVLMIIRHLVRGRIF